VSYRDEGHVGDYWGRAGSGMLFTTGQKILLLERASWVMQGGTWGIPGGAIPVSDKTGRLMPALASAKREVREEIGRVPPHQIVGKYVYQDGPFKFTTFVALVSREFVPRLNDESTDYLWWDPDTGRRLPLHFGVTELLRHWKL
jgi:8-oxo-dGTP pyrophosphatase MutT (NUDIX family)